MTIRRKRYCIFLSLLSMVGCSGAPPSPSPGPWTITKPTNNSTVHVTIANSAISFEGTGVDGKTAGLFVTPAGGNTEIWKNTAPVDSAGKWAKSAIAIVPGKYDLSLAEMNFNTPSPEIARSI